MEAKHFILPAAALVLAGVLVGGQRKRISELRSRNEDLHVRIAVARSATPATEREAPGRVVPHGESIDWEKLAGFFREDPDRQPPRMLSIQRRLLAMEPAELLAALDGIAAMDLDDATRLKLETLILDPLCKKDPEAALDRFKGTLADSEGFQSYMLTHALKDWAKRDVAAAEAWLDREVAAGTFEARSLDGRNASRERFESAVVFGLFAADPARAEERISKLSPELRAGVLRQADIFHKMREGEEIAYAEIARRQLDEKGRVAAIAGRAEKVIGNGGDFAEVDEYLNSVYAAPDERERTAENVARRYAQSLAMKKELSATKIEEMRLWAERDAPGAAGRLSGEALGSAVKMGGDMDFAEASAIALRYRESDGNDDALHSFLSHLDPSKNRAEARKLAETITDPAKRENLLRRFE